MSDEEKLAALVKDTFPAKYQPGASGTYPWYTVTNVSYMDDEQVDKSARLYIGEASPKIKALTIRWDIARKKAGIDNWHESKGSHGIFVRRSFQPPVMGLLFVLLHEVGHVDYSLNLDQVLSKWPKDSVEAYCDYFAFERIEELYGNKTAEEIFKKYLSVGTLDWSKNKAHAEKENRGK